MNDVAECFEQRHSGECNECGNPIQIPSDWLEPEHICPECLRDRMEREELGT